MQYNKNIVRVGMIIVGDNNNNDNSRLIVQGRGRISDLAFQKFMR